MDKSVTCKGIDAFRNSAISYPQIERIYGVLFSCSLRSNNCILWNIISEDVVDIQAAKLI
jgi:hypothetical protein